MSDRVVAQFSAQAPAYDGAAQIQRQVAARLARHIVEGQKKPPVRVLEIGCGTGLLSLHLAAAFPKAEYLLTDIAAPMLAQCRRKLGPGPHYLVMDGECPDPAIGSFDLIVSSLSFQWFTDLKTGLARLCTLLRPGGRLVFSTLGAETFAEWRAAHAALGLACGLHDYPSAANFPWPDAAPSQLFSELLTEHHLDAKAFIYALKTLGAGAPRSDYRPLPLGSFRRLLAKFDKGCCATYEIFYGERTAPADGR